MGESLMRKVDSMGNHISIVGDPKLAGLLVVIDRPDGTQATKQVEDRVTANDVVSRVSQGPSGLEFV
jgi:hypothetical protein